MPCRTDTVEPPIQFAALHGKTRTELALLLGGDPSDAARWLAVAARYGVPQAQTAYAQFLLDGRGTIQNPYAAFRWFLAAASAGSLDAVNMVGRCHEHGWGTRADPAEAARHYRAAAEQGLDWGQYNLAGLLARGAGVPRDRRQALDWYLRAARQGHAKSMNLVGRFLEEGWEVPADPAGADVWYRRAAEGGDFRGQFNHAAGLARLGRTAEAAAWFRRAAEDGTLGFLRSMARALEGHSAPELREVAVFALARCCESREAEDLVAYGRALLRSPDPAAALPWLRRAAAAGHPEARALLRRAARPRWFVWLRTVIANKSHSH